MIISVSYTHLDVYKRQVFKVGRFGMAMAILKKGAHFAFEGLGFAQKIHGIHAFCFGMGK